MNKLNLFNSKKPIHKSCKSQVDPEVFRLNHNESISSFDSPLFGKQRQTSKRIFKTHDTREILLTEPNNSIEIRKSKTRTNLESERVRLAKERLKRINKSESSSNLLKDQDYIIKLQNNLIENLRNEISIIAKGQTPETEEFSDRPKKVKIIEENETFTEDYENELIRLKKCIKRKEEIIKELNIEMDHEIDIRDKKISKLEENLKLVEKSPNFKDLHLNIDSEKREKLKLEKENLELKEQVKIVTEENKILIQNYEEVRRMFFDHEKTLNSIKLLINKISNSECEHSKIPNFIENLYNSNKGLNDKLRHLSERHQNLDEENLNLKAAYSNLQKKLREIKLKVTDEREILLDKLRRKSIKIFELKQMLSSQNSYRNKTKTSEINTNVSDYSVTESQMSIIEEEPNPLKTEKNPPSTSQASQPCKSKHAEKTHNYHQDESTSLKQKVNSLESHIKMIESSVNQLKSQTLSLHISKKNP